MLSRPWADDDEMYEDERLFKEWARRQFGGPFCVDTLFVTRGEGDEDECEADY